MRQRFAVDLPLLVAGFDQARGRFDAAVVTGVSDRAYFGIFESLNWVVSIDDFVKEADPKGWAWRNGYPEGDVVRGLRCARNRVHHRWADALWTEPLIALSADTMLAAETLLGTADSWVWRELDELPEPEKAERWENEEAYRRVLAGQPLRRTLASFRSVLEAVMSGSG